MHSTRQDNFEIKSENDYEVFSSDEEKKQVEKRANNKQPNPRGESDKNATPFFRALSQRLLEKLVDRTSPNELDSSEDEEFEVEEKKASELDDFYESLLDATAHRLGLLHDDQPIELGCNARHPVKIITINHIVHSLTHFAPAIDHFGDITALIPKSSNHDENTISWIDAQSEVFKENYYAGIDKSFFSRNKFGTIKKRLLEWIPEGSKGVLLDIGGRFAEVLLDLLADPEIRPRLLGIIEDTENGHVQYAEVFKNASDIDKENLADFPILSVARSPIKALEDFNVGSAIALATDTVLKTEADELLSRKNVMVLGYGKIGRAISHMVKSLGAKEVVVFDIDPLRLKYAHDEGFSVPVSEEQIQQNLEQVRFSYNEGRRRELLKQSDVLFCATGSAAHGEDGGVLPQEDWELLNDGVYIASCTSRDGEFNAQGLEYFHTTYRVNNRSKELTGDKIFCYTTEEPEAKQINLINDGNSANFLYKACHGPEIYAVQGAILSCLAELIKSEGDVSRLEMDRDENGFFILMPEQVEIVLDCWRAFYDRPTLEIFLERLERNVITRDDKVLERLFKQGSAIEKALLGYIEKDRAWKRVIEAEIFNNRNLIFINNEEIRRIWQAISDIQLQRSKEEKVNESDVRDLYNIVVDTYLSDVSITLFNKTQYTFKNLYIPPNLTETSFEENENHANKNVISFKELLGNLQDFPDNKKIFLVADAGMGKSTFSRYLCYLWALGEFGESDVHFLFLIKLSDLVSDLPRDKSYTLHEIHYHMLLTTYKCPADLARKFSDDLLLDNEKILYILDGFDGREIMNHRAVKTLLSKTSRYIVTSREYFECDLTSSATRKVSINPYSNDQIKMYTQKYFSSERSSEFANWIERDGLIKKLCQRPLFCELIHKLWGEENNSIGSVTFGINEIFLRVSDNLFKAFLEKQSIAEIGTLNFPYGLRRHPLVSKMNYFFSCLSFHQINRVKFSEEDILKARNMAELGDVEIDSLFDQIKNTGLMLVKETEKERVCEFFHDYFKEYFASCYIHSLEEKHQRASFSQLYNIRGNKSYSNVIVIYFSSLRGNAEALEKAIQSVFHTRFGFRSYALDNIDFLIRCSRASNYPEELNKLRSALLKFYTGYVSLYDNLFSIFTCPFLHYELPSLLIKTLKASYFFGEKNLDLVMLENLTPLKRSVILTSFCRVDISFLEIENKKKLIIFFDNLLKNNARIDYQKYFFMFLNPIIRILIFSALMYYSIWFFKDAFYDESMFFLNFNLFEMCCIPVLFFSVFNFPFLNTYFYNYKYSTFYEVNFLGVLIKNIKFLSVPALIKNIFPTNSIIDFFLVIIFSLCPIADSLVSSFSMNFCFEKEKESINCFLHHFTSEIFVILDYIKHDVDFLDENNIKNIIPYYFIAKLSILAKNVVIDEIDLGLQFTGENLNQFVFFPKADFDVAMFKKILLNDPDCSPQRRVSFLFEEEVNEEESAGPLGHLKHD